MYYKIMEITIKWLNFKIYNGWIMENMDKGADSLVKIPQNLSAQVQKFWISMKKGFIGRP